MKRAGRGRGLRRSYARSPFFGIAEDYGPMCTTSSAKLPRGWKSITAIWQDFEFTIQDGKLYMLQTRNGKRTGRAAVRVAIQMVEEKLITQQEAIFRVETKSAL